MGAKGGVRGPVATVEVGGAQGGVLLRAWQRGGPPPLVRLLAVWINMRKMRLSLCLLSAPARGWVTALFGAAGGAVPTRTWQAKAGGQGEGDEGAGAAAGAAAEGRGRRPASERGSSSSGGFLGGVRLPLPPSLPRSPAPRLVQTK